MRKFYSERINISYGIAEQTLLSRMSDCAINYEAGNIFGKYFKDYSSFGEFLINMSRYLHLSNEKINEYFERYNLEYFDENDLVIMFSNENNRNNILKLNSVSEVEDLLFINIDRLSNMIKEDETYMLMFYELEKINTSKVIASVSSL